MIRERLLEDGTVVFDVLGTRGIRLGAYRDLEQAQDCERFWAEALDRDRQILRAREQPPEHAYRLSQLRHGMGRRPRRAGQWPDDPTGEIAASNVDLERSA